MDNSDFVDKNLYNLKKDIKFKLSKMNYDYCIGDKTFQSIKVDMKKNSEFDKTIRRLANKIVDKINNVNNSCIEHSSMNMSNLNTNNASSNINQNSRIANISKQKSSS